jgi:hypothetical protein
MIMSKHTEEEDARFPLEQINIMMDVNVPVSSEDAKSDGLRPEDFGRNAGETTKESRRSFKSTASQSIPFTLKYIHFPDGPPKETLSNFPYFTYRVKYNKDILARMKYSEIIATFFSKSEFERVFRQSKHHERLDATSSPNTKNEYISHNIHTMIEMLFSTYPVPINNEDSYENYIVKNNSSKVSFKDAVPSFLKSAFQSISYEPSYLSIDQQIYTVSKTVWQNEVLNHPVYRKDLIDEYKRFIAWRTLQTAQNKTEMDRMLKDIITNILQTRMSSSFIFSESSLNDSSLDSSYIDDINSVPAWLTTEMTTMFKSLKRAKDKNNIGYLLDRIHHYLQNPRYFKPSSLLKTSIDTLYRAAYSASNPKYHEYIGLIEKDKIDIVDPATAKQAAIDKNKYIDRLKKLIAAFYESDIYVTNDDGITTIDAFISIVDELNEVLPLRTTYSVTVPSELIRIVEQINKNIRNYKIYLSIQSKYFGDSIQLFQDDANADIKAVFEQKHKPYIEFGTKLRKLVRPFRESSNLVFQTMIDEYVESSSVALENYLKKVLDLVKSHTFTTIEWDATVKEVNGYDEAQSSLPLYVGISEYADVSIEKPNASASAPASTVDSIQTKYEISLRVDVIGGKVNRDNMANMACRYRGETLGDMYIRLFSKKDPGASDWELPPRTFIDTQSWLPPPPVQPPVPPPPVQEPVKKKQEGGRKKTRRFFLGKLRGSKKTRKSI